MKNIRNFVIIAHIDHGKSTLADRFLELTGTVAKHKMKAQYLDQMELERERGVTIKMAPVRMIYRANHPETPKPKSQITNKSQNPNDRNAKSLEFGVWDLRFAKSEYILNLIDTPGHSDFAYEVSRALTAVEGAILLVDATQGIQAQTLANFYLAKKLNLKLIGAVNKIDMKPPALDDVIKNLADLIGVSSADIHKISAKTGEGAKELLEAVIREIPPPSSFPSSISSSSSPLSSLVFDSFYDDHRGIIASVRVFSGKLDAGQETRLIAADVKFKIKETGYFTPTLQPAPALNAGEIGYVASGIKDPDRLRIGDTIGDAALPGYRPPKPVVFVSFYPEDADEYEELKKSLQRLRLNDSALTIEPDYNEVLGRGFKLGFLGRFHFEIVGERLEREFNIKTTKSFPSVAYEVKKGGRVMTITNSHQLPPDYDIIAEPFIRAEVITPSVYLGKILQFKDLFRIADIKTRTFGDGLIMELVMPLAEFLADFDDRLKSASEGYASLSYDILDYREGDLVKLEILVAGEVTPALTRIVPREKSESIGRRTIERLKELLPRQQFVQALQASAGGRIVARENIPALKKDVTGYLYGGDRTRKMKLWKKQQKGKKRLKERGRVDIPAEVYRKLI